MLKSLDIAGFKSFVRPTHLEFAGGITAIVGPNGSGKSNVVDAIRWCLGEQSIRELRGARQEDVIYAGRRRTLGAADVAMLLEAAGGWEVEVGRRFFRSGESEYLVNRQRVRLRDVIVALAGAGIDAGRHVVVTQGMADALLTATPHERRGLLEQAAGLSRYREQRDEARQKIGATRASIGNIELVLAEMTPRVTLLRRQARAVAERREAEERLEVLARSWYAYRWLEATTAVNTGRSEADEARARLDIAQTELRRLEASVDDLLAREREAARQRELAVEEAHAAERERDDARRRRDAVTGRIAAIERQSADLQASRLRLGDDLAASERRRAEILARLEEIDHAMETDRERHSAAVVAATRCKKALDDAVREELQVVASLDAARRRRAEAENRMSQLSRLRAEKGAERERLVKRLNAIAETRRARGVEHVEIAASLAKTESETRAAEADLAALSMALRASRERQARIEHLRRRIDDQIGRSRGDVQAIEALQRAAARSINVGLLAGLAVPEGWEKAVAVALGEWTRQTGVIGELPDPEGFRRWRASLDMPGTWADELLLGGPDALLAGILLVETDREGEAVWSRISRRPAHLVGSPPVVVVSRSGTAWEASGRRLAVADDHVESYLRAEGKLPRLRRRLKEMTRRSSTAAQLLEVEMQRLRTLEPEMTSREQKARSCRQKEAELTGMHRVLQRELAASTEELQATHVELGRIESAETSLLEHVAEQEGTVRRFVEEVSVLEQERRQVAHRVGELRSGVDAVDKDLARLAQALAVAEARRASVEATLVAVEETITRLQREREALDAQLLVLETEVRRLAVERSELQEAVPIAEEHFRRESERVRAQPVGGNVRTPDLRPAREQVAAATRDHERAAAVLEQAEAGLASLREEIREELGIRPENLPPAPSETPREADIRRLRNRVAVGAGLDDGVAAEYEELDERRRYLQHHLDDLNRAVEELEEIITVSDREMRSRFAATFAAAREEFGRVCEVMLRGGRGELTQNDDHGVEVRVQLPGKRARATTALSGGEKALVASALLFAVLRIRPTPFCVLDEVDAALDESNVDRYLDVLREVSRDTQTIVVTHNRATMAAADILYGMTMDGDGGTSVLSLNLETYSAS